MAMETPTSELLYWCHQCDAEIIAAEASPPPGPEAQEQAQGVGAGGGEGESRLRGLICPGCGGGFLEAMETARSLRHVRRVMRRREMRREPRESYGGGSGNGNGNSSSNGNGNSSSNGNDVSSQEVLRVIRFLVRSSRDSNLALDSDQVRDNISDTGGEILSNDMAAVSLDSDQTLGVISDTGREIPSHARTLESETQYGLCDCGEIPTHEILDDTSRPLNSVEAQLGLSETNHGISESDHGISDCSLCGLGEINAESTRSLASESCDGISEAHEVISESYDRVSQSCHGISNPGDIESREIVAESARLSNPEPQDESSGSQNGMERYGEEDEQEHEGDAADVDETESDEEDGHIELNDWDSFEEEDEDEDDDDDEDEWEEVELSESDLVVRILEAVDGMQTQVARHRGHIEEEEETRMTEGGGEGSRGHRNNSVRHAHVLSRGLFRRIQAIRRNYNTEIDLDWFESDAYVGNPGDYVDARGFEEVLQQLMETDNSRRGAPPASKSAIEALPLVHIKQQNLDDGSATCAICKDVVAFDELAKQLPCLHLYHSTCILPWLSARNSCPVCRYELPTDDPDYEEEKKKRSNLQQTMQENRSLSASEEPSGDTPGPGRSSNDEPSHAEAIEIHSESFEEVIEIRNDLNSLSNVENENEQEIESGSELNTLENTAKVEVEEIECGSLCNALGRTANVRVEEIECVNESNASVNNVNFKELMGPGTHSNAFVNVVNGIKSRDELDALMNDKNQGEIESVSESNASVNNGNKEEIECRKELNIHGNNVNAKRKPSLIEMIAGPLFSVVGLIIVSCLGNFFLGNGPQKQQRFDRDAKPRRMEEVRKYKPWWLRLFG